MRVALPEVKRPQWNASTFLGLPPATTGSVFWKKRATSSPHTCSGKGSASIDSGGVPNTPWTRSS
ncbi:hypothetical protein SK803_02000 [Lentzea sp. BCCO 10_0856]|uniref:Uncharacterized protein n=1 Tax=Lentzea miocenica TaxID=3095431 RepID=A0ABU4SSZ1_9PSEU|nr:hypothetical protein [Lentzea sp. BCCO 10_0856]MDX8028960.1 hypothetical protein [Lentzea sp. BCCO 10_0856]